MGSRLEAKSTEVRKRIEKHKFEDEDGEEYEPSKFGGFSDYFRRKKIKLQNLDAERRSLAQNNPLIFKGVVAHVNGYTQPSLNDLHTLIVSYGGGFMQYLDSKTMVTHIIASNLTPKKKVEFARYRIVKPAWVVESIEAGKLLPWDAYRVVDEGVGQRVLGFDNGNIISQANNKVGGYRDQTDTSWYTSQVKDVANRLNSRHPDWPFTKTQVSSADEIEFGSVEGLSGNEPAHEEPDRAACIEEERRQDTVLEDSEMSIRPDEKTVGEDNAQRHLDIDLDVALVPAIDESLTVSFPGTQDRSTKTSQEEPLCGIQAASNPLQIEFQQQQRDLLASGSFVVSKNHAEASANVETDQGHRPEILRTGSSTPERTNEEAEEMGQDTIFSSRKAEETTAEEHNALLLADPKVWKSTVVNPGFLKQYYEESRLHHLSAWKAALKSQLQSLASGKTASQKTREKKALGARRYILHVDFDSFFAAVSLRNSPHLVDKPVVVAHGNGAGAEIASCNYPARKYGIKNGMWMKHAQKLCPELKVLPYDFKAYEEASRSFYEAIMDTGGIVQSVSVDEALVDVSAQCNAAGGHDGKGVHEGSIWREKCKADSIAQDLRDLIKEKTGCAVSVGIGGNILLAKVALRRAKPAGQHHIKPEEALDFLGELAMQDLPGIAYSIGGKLEEIGVKYVKDVRELSKERMISVLGPKTGEKVWDYSRGIDRAEVGEQVIRKSVSAEVNWGIRFVTQEQADEFIQSLADELHKRLLNEGVKGRQLTMKIMRRAADAPLDPPKHLGHGKCDTFNKSLVLGLATNDAAVIGREALAILKGFGFSPGELRGLGIQMQKLEPAKGTYDGPSDGSQKRIQFKVSTPRKSTLSRPETGMDDIESPQKPKGPSTPHPAAAFAKTTVGGSRSRTPLNTLGTQFVLPSQVDPEVLKELPSDIRTKLLPKGPPQDFEEVDNEVAANRSRSTTPVVVLDAIPSSSQLDKETLDALPPDVRSEVLAYYARSPHKAHNQAVLPQSPRKARSVKLPRKLTTPTKKRGRPVGGGARKANAAAYSSLTQSNFVANSHASTSKGLAKVVNEDISTDDISAEFLSALPEDIRREVVTQARRDRLQKKGGIDLATKRKRAPPPKTGAMAQRILTLPSRPPKPTFTAQKLTALPELREAITAWYEEFKDDGPYAEDVVALAKYLRSVVTDEGDLNKAVSVAKWLRWLVDEGGSGEDAVWIEAMGNIEQGVQEGVKERGLGRVEF